MPKDDISNSALSKLMKWEFLGGIFGSIFLAGVIWSTLSGQVEANAANDVKIIAQQKNFSKSINDIVGSQRVIKNDVDNIKESQRDQKEDIKYLKAQSDEIKVLLIQISREH